MGSRRAALLAALWLGVAPAAASGRPALDAADVAAFFDAAFEVQRQDHEIAGAVVAVVQRGEVLLLRGYGWADLEARVPADPEQSLFRIASISKPFVWTGILQLAERGELSLDDPVHERVDFPIPQTFAEPIRIRHLLTHTPGFEDRGIGTAVHVPEHLASLRDYLAYEMPRRVRPPGEHVSYSNYGAALAAHVVERVSGQPWPEYVEEHVLAPLDMRSTNARPVLPAALEARHAKGYRWDAGRFEPAGFMLLLDGPAGNMSSTAADMARFMLAHLGGGALDGRRILSAETAARMQQPLFDPHPGISPMLHGFYRSDRNGVRILGHGGDVNQFHSELALLPDHDLGLFVSFNADPGAGARTGLVRAFVDRFFPTQTLRPAPPAAAVELLDYEGEYVPLRVNHSTFERLRILVAFEEVSADGDELVIGDTGRWVATARDRFTARYRDRTAVFERDASGRVTHLVIDSPLSTFERIEGFASPGRLRAGIAYVIVVCLLTLIGYGFRLIQPLPPEQRLHLMDTQLAGTFALLTLGVYGYLGVTLAGDLERFQYGIPSLVDLALTLFGLSLMLAGTVVLFGVGQWIGRGGPIGARLRYAVIASAAAVHLAIGWDFHLGRWILDRVS